MFFDERHGIVMDWATHEYLHRTRGAAIANGFDIYNYIINGGGATLANVQFSLTNGTFFDEDLQVDITTGGSGVWDMSLNPVECPSSLCPASVVVEVASVLCTSLVVVV